MQKYRPFLKWAGGKYQLLDRLKAALPTEASTLIEPFVGAGVLFLNTDYQRYCLSDINADLIGLYQTLQTGPDAFIQDAKRFFSAYTNTSQRYYEYRKQFNDSQDRYHKSLLFLYLNRHGYNGLCRYNQGGLFNVPFGYPVRPYFPEKEMAFFAEKAQCAQFRCESFIQLFERVSQYPASVIYCDPPYTSLTGTKNFTAYHTTGFTAQEQAQLASLARQASRQAQCTVLISNHDTAETRMWYACAKAITSFDAPRRISCRGQTRKPVPELLAHYLPQAEPLPMRKGA